MRALSNFCWKNLVLAAVLLTSIVLRLSVKTTKVDSSCDSHKKDHGCQDVLGNNLIKLIMIVPYIVIECLILFLLLSYTLIFIKNSSLTSVISLASHMGELGDSHFYWRINNQAMNLIDWIPINLMWMYFERMDLQYIK